MRTWQTDLDPLLKTPSRKKHENASGIPDSYSMYFRVARDYTYVLSAPSSSIGFPLQDILPVECGHAALGMHLCAHENTDRPFEACKDKENRSDWLGLNGSPTAGGWCFQLIRLHREQCRSLDFRPVALNGDSGRGRANPHNQWGGLCCQFHGRL